MRCPKLGVFVPFGRFFIDTHKCYIVLKSRFSSSIFPHQKTARVRTKERKKAPLIGTIDWMRGESHLVEKNEKKQKANNCKCLSLNIFSSIFSPLQQRIHLYVFISIKKRWRNERIEVTKQIKTKVKKKYFVLFLSKNENLWMCAW